MNKETYQKLIDDDIFWLKTNTEDNLERRHIIDVLNESVKYHYPEGRYINGKFKDNWEWSDTDCQKCKYFDGYDICMLKNNFGTITTDILNKCFENNYYENK